MEWLGLGSQTLPRQGKDQIIQSRLSSRRGATTEATNDNMTGATLDMVNGWRKRDVFKGTEPGLAMRQVYTDALSAIKTTIQYSQSLWGPRGYDSKLSTFEICANLSQSGTASTRRRIAWDWINGDREVDTTVETIGIKPKGKILIATAMANLISLPVL